MVTYISVDVATRSLAVGVYRMQDLGVVTENAPRNAVKLSKYLDSLIEPIFMDAFDLNHGKKTKDTTVAEKATELKHALAGVDMSIADKISGEKVIVVIEYQMSANYCSNAIFNMIVYHYAGRFPVEVIKPSWKNTVALHPQLTLSFFLGCCPSNYKANKKHTLYNMLYFLIMVDQVDMIKDIKPANQDDIADTLMQAISWHLRH